MPVNLATRVQEAMVEPNTVQKGVGWFDFKNGATEAPTTVVSDLVAPDCVVVADEAETRRRLIRSSEERTSRSSHPCRFG